MRSAVFEHSVAMLIMPRPFHYRGGWTKSTGAFIVGL